MDSNEKLIVIHQPDFAPYLGFFHRLVQADIYIVLDNVQFIRGGSNCWTNRDKIKTKNGEKWLTIPCKKAPLGTNINEIEINNDVDWKNRNLKMIADSYAGADGFDEVYPYIKKLHDLNTELLWEFNFASIKMLIELFDIDVEVKISSEMKPEGKSNARVIDLVKKCGSHRYLSGTGARDYFDPVPYEEAGVEVIWQDFTHPIYDQVNGSFIPYLSSIDLLLNCGIRNSREIFRRTFE